MVGSGSIACSCAAECFMNGDCCEDILEVPCLPGEVATIMFNTSYSDMQQYLHTSTSMHVMCMDSMQWFMVQRFAHHIASIPVLPWRAYCHIVYPYICHTYVTKYMFMPTKV